MISIACGRYKLPKQRFVPLLILIAFTVCANDESSELLNEPGIIDAHAHIGKFRGFDLSLENLLLNMKENRISYALISNIDGADVKGMTANSDQISVNQETARVAAQHPELIPLAWAKPGAKGASAEQLEPFLRDRHFAGIKFHPEFNHFDPEAPVVQPYLQMCEKYRVPAVFHCGDSWRSGPEVLYRVAKKFPEVPFVLYHMGFGSSHRKAIEVARLAKEENRAMIYLETAQCKAPEILEALKAVDADRILFGTDATYYGRYHYSKYKPALVALKNATSPEDFRKIIHDNAARLFRINAKPKN